MSRSQKKKEKKIFSIYNNAKCAFNYGHLFCLPTKTVHFQVVNDILNESLNFVLFKDIYCYQGNDVLMSICWMPNVNHNYRLTPDTTMSPTKHEEDDQNTRCSTALSYAQLQST